MKVPKLVARLLGRDVKEPELERADELLDHIKSVRITVVPKNRRALDELRRLQSHARR